MSLWGKPCAAAQPQSLDESGGPRFAPQLEEHLRHTGESAVVFGLADMVDGISNSGMSLKGDDELRRYCRSTPTRLVARASPKLTDVYLDGIYQHVSGTGGSGLTADINGLTASSTNSQVAATIGLRHRF